MDSLKENNQNTSSLFQELSIIIEKSKQQVQRAANSTLSLLFWHVGKRINDKYLTTNVRIMVNKL